VPVEVTGFQPEYTPEVIALSMRAWAPVFLKLKPAVADYVYEAFYPNGWDVRQRADIEAFLANDAPNIWLAVDGSKIVGWVGIRLHPEDMMGEVYILAVDPDRQARGIGKQLIDHAITEMRRAGMSIAMVETGDDPGHAPSRAAYERSGFERWPVARYFKKI
jgi:GNAT superfamily N-acetyltransferase